MPKHRRQLVLAVDIRQNSRSNVNLPTGQSHRTPESWTGIEMKAVRQFTFGANRNFVADTLQIRVQLDALRSRLHPFLPLEIFRQRLPNANLVRIRDLDLQIGGSIRI